MTAFFVTEVQFVDGALAAARICTPMPTGTLEAPDHVLSLGSVVALPELTALVELTEVRLVTWMGPDDWCPIDRLVIRGGIFVSVDEEGTPTDSLRHAPRTQSKDLPSL